MHFGHIGANRKANRYRRPYGGSWDGGEEVSDPLEQLLTFMDGAECRTVLRMVSRLEPQLAEVIRTVGLGLLSAPDPAAVSDDVEDELLSMPHTDLADRAGPQDEGGYVEPTDAAWELLEEAIEPWAVDVERRATLGLVEAAAVITVAIVEGLRRCHPAPVETVLEWAPEAPEELAGQLLRRAEAAGVSVDPDELTSVASDWFD